MVTSITEFVSTPESKLLETMDEIQFGEMFGVQVDDGDRWIEYSLTPAQRDLIGYIREGAQYIDILTVHHGQPVLAETDLKIDGFRCRKKVKFPTV